MPVPILDNFARADSSTSLGGGWTQLHPGGALGFLSSVLGISSNQGYNSNTASANKGSAVWNAQTFRGSVEGQITLTTLAADWMGIALRAANLNGASVKFYLAQMKPDGSWDISRFDSSSSATSLASGSVTAPSNGDMLRGVCYTDASGNVITELWYNHGGTWTTVGVATDSSGSKITADGYVGTIWGNTTGSGAGRFDDFSAGASQDSAIVLTNVITGIQYPGLLNNLTKSLPVFAGIDYIDSGAVVGSTTTYSGVEQLWRDAATLPTVTTINVDVEELTHPGGSWGPFDDDSGLIP